MVSLKSCCIAKEEARLLDCEPRMWVPISTRTCGCMARVHQSHIVSRAGWGDNEDDLFADNDDVLDLSLSLSAKKPAAKIVRKPVSKVVRKASGSTARAGSTAGRAQVKARPAAKKKASILATPVVADVSAELDLDMDMDAWGSKSATQTEAASGGGGWDDLDGWGATDAKTKGKAPAAGNQKKPAAKAETEEWGWD